MHQNGEFLMTIPRAIFKETMPEPVSSTGGWWCVCGLFMMAAVGFPQAMLVDRLKPAALAPGSGGCDDADTADVSPVVELGCLSGGWR